jgi:hypothetical protein
MLLVNFLTFVMKILYLLYMVFILIPIAIIWATLLIIYTFIEWLIDNMKIQKY